VSEKKNANVRKAKNAKKKKKKRMRKNAFVWKRLAKLKNLKKK